MNGQTPKFEDRTTPPATDWLGIASFALGLISLCCCCFLEVGALAGALATVLACLSRARFGRFSALAVAGLGQAAYYVNGRLLESAANHSNWPSVTYDAINHAVATAPLHLIVSGQVMGKSWPWFDKTGAKFPETYKVDYVRAYAMPEKSASLPSVEWRGAAAEDDGTLKFFDEGEKMRFEVAPSVSAKSGAGIACVYLYDAGYLIGYKKKAPYVFDVELTKDWYSRTRYMSTGRQKVVPDFAKAPHSFVAFVHLYLEGVVISYHRIFIISHIL